VSELPKQMGPYQIRREIGSGGMGVVYEGGDARLNRRVAVKTLWPALAQRDEARERFLREARAAAAVSHPNVTQIYDIGEQDGRVYFAMELLEAKSLQEVLREEGTLPAERAISVVRQAALGLKAASERGIIHRDIKPSNLVFNTAGTLKITDFGLAKQILADKDLTMDGQTIGTPKYVSPEQASGRTVDARSDIYSLGATLYEMVTGQPPFNGSTPMEVMLKHVKEPVPPIQQINPAVPRSLAILAHRMLSKQPGARPQSHDELLALLDRVADGDLTAGATNVGTVQIPTVPAVVLAEAKVKPNFAGRLFGFTLLALVVVIVGALAIKSIGNSSETTDSPLPVAGLTGSTGGGFGTASASPAEERPVLGPATPPGSPVLLQQPVEGGGAVLEIVDARHEITEDGRLIVTGQVSNTGTSKAMNTKVRISLTDDRGNLVTATEVFVTPQRLVQGEDGKFEAVFPDPEQNVKIVFELNWIS
jgi:hypothetical protein